MFSGIEWLIGALAICVLVELLSRLPIATKLKIPLKLRTILGLPDPNYPRPTLEDGEEIIREGKAVFSMSFFGGRVGRLMLTKHRFHWYETRNVSWPFKRIVGHVKLSQIESVDKGTLIDFVGGGRRLRLRLRNGKDKCLWEDDGRLDEWIATIRRAIAQAADS